MAHFLRNHSTQIAAMDLFVVPSLTFKLFYVSSSSSWPAEMLLAGRNKDRLHAARDEVGTSAADTLVLDVTE